MPHTSRLADGLGRYLPPVCIAVPFFFLVWRDQINAELWCDEVGSLVKFILVPLSRTVSYYPEPNNHIFANLLANLYLKLLGISDLAAVEAAPWLVRLLPLAFTALAVVYTHRLARLWWDDLAAGLSVAVLVTSVPFFHFATQLRGYPLSVALTIVALYSCARVEATARLRDGLAAAGACAALVYTIPYNVFFALGLGGYQLAVGFFRAGPGPRRGFAPARAAAAWVAAGTLCGAALYLPVYTQIVNNPYAKPGRLFNWEVLTRLAPSLLSHFLSARFLLLPVMLGGALAIFLDRGPNRRPQYAERFRMLAVLFAAPILLTFVRGVIPYDRLFVILVPVFALMAGSSLAALARLLTGNTRAQSAYALLAYAYCLAVFCGKPAQIKAHLAENIRAGVLEQNLSLGYYQYYYQPVETIAKLTGAPGFSGSVYQHGYALLGMDFQARGIVERSVNSASEVYFDEHGQALIVSTAPEAITAEIAEVYENARCLPVDDAFGFHHVLSCSCAAPCRKRHLDLAANPRLADLGILRRALESYRADHGAYPVSQGFAGLYSSFGASGPDWIKGLVPGYLAQLPRDPRLNDDPANQYLYASDGKDFKLLAHHPEDCPDVRQERPELVDPVRGCFAYGFWTEGAKAW